MHSATLRSPELNASNLSTVPTWVDRLAYPFQSRCLEILPGASMHYVDEGAGDVSFFVHGTPTWSFEWRDAIRQLSSPAEATGALREFVERPR